MENWNGGILMLIFLWNSIIPSFQYSVFNLWKHHPKSAANRSWRSYAAR